MKILVDMNLPPVWTAFLGDSGFQAIHWSQVGPHTANDAELMSWAASHDHVVLTADLDFGSILAATQEKRPSVVQIRSDILSLSAIGHVVVQALRQAERQLSEGALISVDAARARLRILPLGDSST